ncbi:MAG TPA: hypothetical protein PKA16_06560 [Ottowia sp.]|uniref:hypothetical protein n=1 Tax=Ottowia sp. TaxID=1898956 RepID=UPI002BE8FF4C|nr:hypothetical protein [Ottowia sp.]HMN21037.1 hypothetical protein [Ottowia sp.]
MPTLRNSAQVLRLADFRTPRRRPIGDAPARRAGPAGTVPRGGAHVVRITHFPERDANDGRISRLRISGRLADVCAELDRLAEAEARALAAMRRA